MAEKLVAMTGPHAWSRLRHEHAEWVMRTMALNTVERSANAVTYGWAANWTFIAGDHDGAIALGWRGIALAAAPEHPDTTGCWAALTWANLASGRASEARAPARNAQIAASDNPDLWAQAWAHIAMIEDAMAADPSALVEVVDRYVHWADRVGSTALLAGAAFYEGQLKLSTHRSGEAQGVLDIFRHGLELARKVGDLNNEGKNLVGLIGAATRFRSPEASALCRETVTRLYDTRHWSLGWVSIDTVARWLVATDKFEEAAVVYGHLDAHQPAWDNAGGRRGRTRGLEIVRQHPLAEQQMARGAMLGRDELVAYVLEQLD